MKSFDKVADLAMFVQAATGSTTGQYKGKMTAAEQRALFGQYIGKGIIVIDGLYETVCNRVSVCFGNDYDDRNVIKWAAL